MRKYKPKSSLLLFSIIFWLMVAFYYALIRYTGLGGYAPPGLSYYHLFGYSMAVGSVIGLLFGLFPISYMLLSKKRLSFSSALLTGTICYVLFFIAVIFFTSWYGNSLQFATQYVFTGNGLTVLFHLSVASLLYHFILQVNRRFGPGVLLQYVCGQYFSPKVEERCFMFLDLKSSTRTAEMLDHVNYSRLLQDCYAQLTESLIEYDAQVYQYVGDEVVISWKMDPKFYAVQCLHFFYGFQQRLNEKESYFVGQYGVRPSFKAGLHCGRVTIAEVGELKTEIAFHGDVLNTASRIQHLCNRLQKDLLVSEAFLELLSLHERERALFVSEEVLRGKEVSTRLYAI